MSASKSCINRLQKEYRALLKVRNNQFIVITCDTKVPCAPVLGHCRAILGLSQDPLLLWKVHEKEAVHL